MTTEYRDKNGNLLRTDPGTRPRAHVGRQHTKPAAPADKPAADVATTADASAPAEKKGK